MELGHFGLIWSGGDKMKKFLIEIATFVALCASCGTASSADLVTDGGYDWSGMFVGIQGGYAWGETRPSSLNIFNNIRDTATVNYSDFVSGIESGYNWQSENLVLGFESSTTLFGISGYERGPDRPCSFQGCHADVEWFSTGRIRAGYAMDRVLPFIAGGLAMGQLKGTFDNPACSCHINDLSLGWTVGGGVEWAVNDKWSLKAEYLYVNLGKPSVKGTPGGLANFINVDKYDFDVARVAVNYHFSFW